MYQAPGHCPTCSSLLELRELGCPQCGTTVRGEWSPTPFQRLSADQQAFLILFVRSRGNLSEVERALGVSYPTVRAKLEELIGALEERPSGVQPEEAGSSSARKEILERVSRGEITTREGLELMRQIQGGGGDND